MDVMFFAGIFLSPCFLVSFVFDYAKFFVSTLCFFFLLHINTDYSVRFIVASFLTSFSLIVINIYSHTTQCRQNRRALVISTDYMRLLSKMFTFWTWTLNKCRTFLFRLLHRLPTTIRVRISVIFGDSIIMCVTYKHVAFWKRRETLSYLCGILLTRFV